MEDKETEKKGILVAAAKALGSAAGKVVTLAKPVGAQEQRRIQDSQPSRTTKFVRHTKSRLPRKLKKANKKIAAAAN